MQTVRVATLNIWSRFGPWEERLGAIRAGLAELAPDIVGLQEVLRFEGFDQAALVSEGLGYAVAWGQASENFGYPIGNAILSKFPIERTEVVPLPDVGTDERRALVCAEIQAPFGKVPFFVTHLNWRLDQGHVRQVQVKAVAAAVARLRSDGDFPPVLVGDFNAEPEADEVRYLRGLTALGGESVYFADAFAFAAPGERGATFSKQNPFAAPLREPERRIDYVFVGGPDDVGRGEPLEARVCFDRPYAGTYASDHYGVIATLRV